MHTYKIDYYCYCLCFAVHNFYCKSNSITIEPPLTPTRKMKYVQCFDSVPCITTELVKITT